MERKWIMESERLPGLLSRTIYESENVVLARVFGATPEQRDSNAKLIALAPRMAEAIINLVNADTAEQAKLDIPLLAKALEEL